MRLGGQAWRPRRMLFPLDWTRDQRGVGSRRSGHTCPREGNGLAAVGGLFRPSPTRPRLKSHKERVVACTPQVAAQQSAAHGHVGSVWQLLMTTPGSGCALQRHGRLRARGALPLSGRSWLTAFCPGPSASAPTGYGPPTVCWGFDAGTKQSVARRTIAVTCPSPSRTWPVLSANRRHSRRTCLPSLCWKATGVAS